MGVPYNNNCKKAELIIKVKDARKAMQNNDTVINDSPIAEICSDRFEHSTSGSVENPTDNDASVLVHQTRFRPENKSWCSAEQNSRLVLGYNLTVYYYDEKKDRYYFLLIYLFFLMEMLGSYIDILLLNYISELIILLQIEIALLGIANVFLLMLKLVWHFMTCILCAKVNIAPFLNDVHLII